MWLSQLKLLCGLGSGCQILGASPRDASLSPNFAYPSALHFPVKSSKVWRFAATCVRAKHSRAEMVNSNSYRGRMHTR